jgi:MFS family permease
VEITVASTPTSAGQVPISPLVRWLILILASIGFAFDIYELLMLPLVGPDALPAMGHPRGSPGFVFWVQLLFYVPALFGGLFGLLGGYLTDRLGRRRVLTWSIMIYALSAFLSGFVTTPLLLLVLRCGVFVGVCVEFVAAVAWLAELFPNPEEREKALGYTQAFSSFGGLLVAIAYGICANYGQYFHPISITDSLQGWFGAIPDPQQHAAWRYTLMSGLIPAIPLLLIRPFLPESPVWQQKKRAGTLRRPSIRELFTTPQLRWTTIVTTIMFACSYGVAFGAIQQMRNIVPGLEVVQKDVQPKIAKAVAAAEEEKGAELTTAEVKKISGRITTPVAGKINASYTKVQELGGLLGRFLLALLVVRIVSRRALLRVFQVPGLILTPLVFFYFLKIPNDPFFTLDLSAIYLGKWMFTPVSMSVFLVALCTIAQFSFWGNYLPRVFPLHLRGTGESFAANVGGRMIGTSFAAVSLGISALMPGDTFDARMAVAAAAVGGFVYLVGFIMSFFLPEPGQELEEFAQGSADVAGERLKPAPAPEGYYRPGS